MARPSGLRPICFFGLTLHEEWLGYDANRHSSIFLALPPCWSFSIVAVLWTGGAGPAAAVNCGCSAGLGIE